MELGPVALPGEDGAFLLEVADGRSSVTRRPSSPLRLALPAFADLHVHADRAFARGPRPPRSLADAVELVAEIKRASTEEVVRERATRSLHRALAHGSLRVRTHVDVDELIGERGLRGVLAAREAVAGRVDVEIVAFATKYADPTTADGEARLERLWTRAPTFSAGFRLPPRSRRLDRARARPRPRELGLPADLHVDEASSA